ncbi:3-dehydroquinate dehydratase [Sulfurimonas sp.]|uniref:3-dehydroquinate dehydratase n=1 Tax=Sulfurimonas sp. TaxID=2022749 RepID=UPI0025CCBA76|nr:3-dehydroquinate dehydratase [Sulfurimonas sp.]MBT5935289.1 3-dehydroquinate dehydratase [Sulfurimonas sp.]
MNYSRGLAALIFTLFFQTQLIAEYLYKDEVVFNEKFSDSVERVGTELFSKTGISLRLLMLRDLPVDTKILEYEKKLVQEFTEPTITLVFAEMDSKVDIFSNDESLYKYFDKKQVLSPNASSVQAYLMAIIYARSWDNFKEISSSNGGTILPLLGQRSKSGEVVDKYSAAMFNGYLDIAEQIAMSHGHELTDGTGQSGKYVFMAVKIFFYGVILYAVIMLIKRKLYRKRQENESL